MLHFLKNHPFRVNALLERSVVLTFAVPKEALDKRIPECLTLDLFQDKWAFIAIAMVQTRELRPHGFPKFLGNDFFLMGYRIFVRYKNQVGKRLRGLYILKSETNKKKMEFVGNLFTHYQYTTTDILQTNQGDVEIIASQKSNFRIEMNPKATDVSLPEGSPFATWKEARRFAGPLPFTFTYNANKQQVLIIEGVRQNWIPKPTQIVSYQVSFLQDLKLPNAVLANAFIIQDVPYYWKKGKIERWQS